MLEVLLLSSGAFTLADVGLEWTGLVWILGENVIRSGDPTKHAP